MPRPPPDQGQDQSQGQDQGVDFTVTVSSFGLILYPAVEGLAWCFPRDDK